MSTAHTHRALIIVDVQPTFCEGGELGIEGGNAVAEAIAEYVAENRDSYDLIVTTQDWHVDPGEHWSTEPDYLDTWPPHGIAGTPGAELHPALADLDADVAVKKGEYEAAYSGFEGRTEDGRTLTEVLQDGGITAVDIAGLAESHCVKETALDALAAGFSARVLMDLTVPVSEELGEHARMAMSSAGAQLIASDAPD